MPKTWLSIFFITTFFISSLRAQTIQWTDVSDTYGPLPASVKLFKTVTPIDGKPNIAFYLAADLNDPQLHFQTDTSKNRRLTPQQFYEKNNQPLVVVNTTFFSFATNQNLNIVVKDGKMVSYNIHSLPGRRTDTLTYRHPFGSAIGISKNRKADIAWLYTDSSLKKAYAFQQPVKAFRDSASQLKINKRDLKQLNNASPVKKWNVESAVGGGPVLVQDNKVMITNDEEIKFAGKAIDDRHPRTAMGYTNDNKLVILVVQGRMPGVAEGASLKHLADMFISIGCKEALNLDGGGSSSLIVNGKQTILPSDKTGQRPVPAVFMISTK